MSRVYKLPQAEEDLFDLWDILRPTARSTPTAFSTS